MDVKGRWTVTSACGPYNLGGSATNFNKVPFLAASITSFLSLLSSLIGKDAILNLDGHTLDIELLGHLLYLFDKFD